MGFIALVVKPGLRGRTSYRKDNMFSDADGITGEPQCFILGNGEAKPIGNTVGYSRLAVGIECGWEIQQLTATQGTETGIEMVETIVHQFERDNLLVKPRTENREGMDIRSLSIAAEPDIRKAQEVPGSFKTQTSLNRHDIIAVFTKPSFKMSLLSLPFRIPEVADNRSLSDNDPGIGGKHEIG